MSFKPELLVQGGWYDNAQRFATYEEAKRAAASRHMVWTMSEDYRAVASDEPVNYTFDDDGAHYIGEP